MKRVALALVCLLALSAGAQAQSCGAGVQPSGGNIIPLSISGVGSTGVVTATLPAAANKYTYLCGWMITSAGAPTTASAITATITGVGSSTLSFAYLDPTSGQGFLGASMAPYCLTTLTQNTAIIVSVPVTVGTLVKTVTAWGCNQ